MAAPNAARHPGRHSSMSEVRFINHVNGRGNSEGQAWILTNLQITVQVPPPASPLLAWVLAYR